MVESGDHRGTAFRWAAFGLANLVAIALGAAPMHFLSRTASDIACFDLRRNKEDLRYFVIVNSRDAISASHTWITWQWNDPARDVPTFQSIGFYADIGAHMAEALLEPEGRTLDEQQILERLRQSGAKLPATRTAIVFYVDRNLFEASKGILARWEAGRIYRLFADDCVSFVGDVLAWFGMKIPARIFALSPHAFVQAVIEMNPDDGRQCG